MSTTIKSAIHPGEFPPHKYTETLAKVKAQILPLLQSNEGFTLYGESDGVKTYTKQSDESPVPIVKGECSYALQPEQVRAVLLSYPFRKDWDDMYLSIEPVELLTPNTGVFLARFAAPFPLTAREFVTVSDAQYFNDKEDEFLTLNTTVMEPEKCPESSSYVRGVVVFATYLIRPDPANPGQTLCTYVVLQNPGGSIPNWLVASSAPKFTAILNKTKKIAEKKPEFVEKCCKWQQERAALALEQYTAKTSGAQ